MFKLNEHHRRVWLLKYLWWDPGYLRPVSGAGKDAGDT